MLDQTEHIDWYASAVEEGISQGLEQGQRQVLLGILAQRFAKQEELPKWAVLKVNMANSEQITAWIEQIFTAESLEQILG